MLILNADIKKKIKYFQRISAQSSQYHKNLAKVFKKKKKLKNKRLTEVFAGNIRSRVGIKRKKKFSSFHNYTNYFDELKTK